MTQDKERLQQTESEAAAAPGKSLVAFLRSIKFAKPKADKAPVEKEFAQPHPRTPRVEDDSRWVPSAN